MPPSMMSTPPADNSSSSSSTTLSGLCNQCGTKLYDIKQTKKLFSSQVRTIRTPLTRQGSCLKGECMKCNITNPMMTMSRSSHNTNNTNTNTTMSRSNHSSGGGVPASRRYSTHHQGGLGSSQSSDPTRRRMSTGGLQTTPIQSYVVPTSTSYSSRRGAQRAQYYQNAAAYTNDTNQDSDIELAIAMSMIDVQEIERRPTNMTLRSTKSKSSSSSTTTGDHSVSSSLAPGAYNVIKHNDAPNPSLYAGSHSDVSNDKNEMDATYEGDYNSIQQRHGQGLLTFTNNDYFVGTFVNGQRQGTGSYYWNDGSVYEGEWYQNNMHGTGKRTFPNGNVYTGQYVNGKRCGKGVCHYAATNESSGNGGDVYDGEWDNDVPHGMGIYYYSSTQQSYQGMFHNGQRHGVGKYQLRDGRLDICKYEKNQRCSDGVRWSKSRNRAWKINAQGKEVKRISEKEAFQLQNDMGWKNDPQQEEEEPR